MNEALLFIFLTVQQPVPGFFPGYEPLPNPTPEEQIIIDIPNSGWRQDFLIKKA